MNTTRSVRPTDLVALVSLDGRVSLNEARIWERLGEQPERPGLVNSGITSWIPFGSRRRTWVSVEGQSIRGLVSARPRAGRGTWEIDRLISASEDELAVCALLERVSAAAARSGVTRIFLRLETGSDMAGAARRAGFAAYLQERLLRADGPVTGAAMPDSLVADAYQAADAFALYRLYNAAAPEGVRRVEAPTFQQWVSAAEYRNCGRSQLDYVIRRDLETVARLRAVRGRGSVRIDLSVHPSAEESVAALLGLISDFAAARRPVYCLVPSYAEGVERRLSEAGFGLDSQYVVSMKRTAMPVAAGLAARSRLAAANPIAAV